MVNRPGLLLLPLARPPMEYTQSQDVLHLSMSFRSYAVSPWQGRLRGTLCGLGLQTVTYSELPVTHAVFHGRRALYFGMYGSSLVPSLPLEVCTPGVSPCT
jgi:hypothetical protein